MATARSKQREGQSEGTDGEASIWVLLAVLVAALGAILYQFGLRAPTATLDVKSPQIALPQGTLLGTILSDRDLPVPIEAWLGVPYARPPIGPLRFARPESVVALKQRFNATQYGHRYVMVASITVQARRTDAIQLPWQATT